MFSISHPPSTEAFERSSREKLSDDSIEPVLKQLSWKGGDENRRNLGNGQLPSHASACEVTADETRPVRERGGCRSNISSLEISD